MPSASSLKNSTVTLPSDDWLIARVDQTQREAIASLGELGAGLDGGQVGAGGARFDERVDGGRRDCRSDRIDAAGRRLARRNERRKRAADEQLRYLATGQRHSPSIAGRRLILDKSGSLLAQRPLARHSPLVTFCAKRGGRRLGRAT